MTSPPSSQSCSSPGRSCRRRPTVARSWSWRARRPDGSRSRKATTAGRRGSSGEGGRFAQKVGVQSLIDRESKRFTELGLKSALLSEERWLEKLTLEPLLLRMPLVRYQQQLSVGAAEETWRAWLAAAQASP